MSISNICERGGSLLFVFGVDLILNSGNLLVIIGLQDFELGHILALCHVRPLMVLRIRVDLPTQLEVRYLGTRVARRSERALHSISGTVEAAAGSSVSYLKQLCQLFLWFQIVVSVDGSGEDLLLLLGMCLIRLLKGSLEVIGVLGLLGYRFLVALGACDPFGRMNFTVLALVLRRGKT